MVKRTLNWLIRRIKSAKPDSICRENPILVYPDGSEWCALWGQNLMEGIAGFGQSPEEAVANLMKEEGALAKEPHAE